MSTDAPAVGREHKPNIKNEGNVNTGFGRRNNHNARKFIKKDHFQLPGGTAKRDFINLRQQKHQSVQEYSNASLVSGTSTKR